jgi:hypothetical protein
MPKPAAGDRGEEEPMDTSPKTGAGAGSGSSTVGQSSPESRSPMVGDRGMAATTTGKVAKHAGDATYSPSQSANDWSVNLTGVRRIMEEGGATPSPPPGLTAGGGVCACPQGGKDAGDGHIKQL